MAMESLADISLAQPQTCGDICDYTVNRARSCAHAYYRCSSETHSDFGKLIESKKRKLTLYSSCVITKEIYGRESDKILIRIWKNLYGKANLRFQTA